MASSSSKDQNIAKCLQAITTVCRKAVPCITHSIKTWQQQAHQATLLPPMLRNCTGMGGCPTSGGKPKLSKGSCASCVSWGQAVENQVYPPGGQLQWPNVDPTQFSVNPIEVAKGFVLRLKTCGTVATFGELDAASLLMVMMGFKEFHKSNAAAEYDIIKQVSAIRNTLSHMSLDSNLHVSNTVRDQYFNDVRKLMLCLQRLYPSQFTSDVVQELTDELKDIQTSGVINQISWESIAFRSLSMLTAVFIIYMIVWGYCGFAYCHHGVCVNLIYDYKCNCEPGFYGNHCEFEEEQFDIRSIQEQLREFYNGKRGTVPLLPGVPERCAEMENIFINLELEKAEYNTQGITKHSIGHEKLISFKRILASGIAGIGKTTLVSKLAYDWSQEKPYISARYQLVFVLDIDRMKLGMDLIDVIRNQLLSKLSRDGMLEYLKSNASSVFFIFDGYDEASQLFDKRHKVTDIIQMLQNRWLATSAIMVTTRPHKVTEFVDRFGVYKAHVRLSGFSLPNMYHYIIKFFDESPQSVVVGTKTSLAATNMIKTLSVRPKLKELCAVPMMLSMLCLIWNENQKLPDRITPLYETAAIFLVSRTRNILYNDPQNIPLLKDIVLKMARGLGKPALYHMLTVPPDLQRIIKQLATEGFDREYLLGLEHNVLNLQSQVFLEEYFDAEVLKLALQVGFVSKERNLNNKVPLEYVRFFHKTIQDYCAAVYLVSLFAQDRDLFDFYLQKINSKEKLKHLEYLLTFSSGLNTDVASVIISHVVSYFPPVSVLDLSWPSRQQCHSASFRDLSIIDLLFSLFYEAHVCKLYDLLATVFNHIDEVVVHKEFIPEIQYFISCILTNQHKLLGNVTKANFTRTQCVEYAEYFNVLKVLTGLQELQIYHQCSNMRIKLDYKRNQTNMVSSLTIVGEMDNVKKTPSLMPLLSIFFNIILDHFDSNSRSSGVFSIQEFSLFSVDNISDDLTHFLSKQLALNKIIVVNCMLSTADVAKLVQAVQSTNLNKLDISLPYVDRNVSPIPLKPLLGNLQSLRLRITSFSHFHWQKVFDTFIEFSSHNVSYNVIDEFVHDSSHVYNSSYIGKCKQYMPMQELDLSNTNLSGSLYKLALVLKCMPYLRILQLRNMSMNGVDIQQFRLALTDVIKDVDHVGVLKIHMHSRNSDYVIHWYLFEQ